MSKTGNVSAPEDLPTEVHDEVCGMRFPAAEAAATAEYGGKTYYFCAERCRRRFLEHPTS